jgi:hypothetical protein
MYPQKELPMSHFITIFAALAIGLAATVGFTSISVEESAPNTVAACCCGKACDCQECGCADGKCTDCNCKACDCKGCECGGDCGSACCPTSKNREQASDCCQGKAADCCKQQAAKKQACCGKKS